MKVKLIVTDLDNTLYDWVAYFVPAFYAMVEKTIEIVGCDRDALLDDFRQIHRKHHNSEHPYSLLETRTVLAHYEGLSRKEIATRLDEAFHAFNSRRKSTLKLYPGVRETLQHLRNQGIKIVAHTESNLFAVVDRLTRLQIEHYFDAIFCREGPAQSGGKNHKWTRFDGFPLEKIRELSHHQRKPDPDVLKEICHKAQVQSNQTAYVGDSLTRDMLLAERAGVTSIWARYGTHHDPKTYDQLIRISHWTPEDIGRERALQRQVHDLAPDYILENGFDELIAVLGDIEVKAVAGNAKMD